MSSCHEFLCYMFWTGRGYNYRTSRNPISLPSLPPKKITRVPESKTKQFNGIPDYSQCVSFLPESWWAIGFIILFWTGRGYIGHQETLRKLLASKNRTFQDYLEYPPCVSFLLVSWWAVCKLIRSSYSVVALQWWCLDQSSTRRLSRVAASITGLFGYGSQGYVCRGYGRELQSEVPAPRETSVNTAIYNLV